MKDPTFLNFCSKLCYHNFLPLESLAKKMQEMREKRSNCSCKLTTIKRWLSAMTGSENAKEKQMHTWPSFQLIFCHKGKNQLLC